MQQENAPHEPAPPQPEPDPTFGDLLRFLWGHRVRLLTLFFFFAGVAAIGLILWRLAIARPVVEGTLSLTFRGMERHEYPSGKKFSVEDIRGPEVLLRAREAAGIKADAADLRSLYVGVEITPVIPPEVQARWRKQDRDGAKRDQFFPSEFRLRMNSKGLSTDQKLQFMTSLVKAYQDQVKFEQEASLRRLAELSTLTPAEMIQKYDFWDLPTLLHEGEKVFIQQLDILIAESRDFRDPRFGVSFRDSRAELSLWDSTQLEALTAFIYRGRLVKDKDLMIKRLERRNEELEIQWKQASGEAEQSTKLVESLDRSKPLLAGPLTNREGASLVDSTALEKLVRSDYVGPVVRRISDLLRQTKEIEAERNRCQVQLAILSRANGVVTTPPAGFEALLGNVTTELRRIVVNYNKLLDDYLDATVTTVVILKEGPLVTREGPSLAVRAAVLLLISAILPFLIVFFERAFRQK